MMKPTIFLALILILASTCLAEDAQSVAPLIPVQDKGQGDQVPGPAPVARPVSPEPATAPSQLKIILLKPSIRFEDVHSGIRNEGLPGLTVAMPSVSQGGQGTGSEQSYEYILLSAARSGVGSKATPLDADALGPAVMDACTKLEPLASRLARGNVNEEAAKDLASLREVDESYAILAQFLRVEVGPGASWNPNSGAITSSTNSTLIQAALVSGKTGKVIWKGERLVRNKALKPTDAAMGKVLTELYRDFVINREGTK